MSIFDPKTFGSMEFTGANATESVTTPVGEFFAAIKSVDVKTWESHDKTKGGLKLAILWNIDGSEKTPDGPPLKDIIGRDSAIVRQDIMLDLNDAGMLDFGKGMNVALGRLREAIGLNRPGEAWSFPMFVGRQAKVNVVHRADPQDPSKLYAEVKGVTAG